MSQIHSVLLATDFSEACACAFNLAVTLAHSQDARLIVLHVAETVIFPPAAGEPQAAPRLLKPKEVLWDHLLRLKAEGAELRLEHRLAEGDPATEVLCVARETRCDLIVMGLHGRTGVEYLLRGSIVERVMRDARCPVLLVKPPGPSFP